MIVSDQRKKIWTRAKAVSYFPGITFEAIDGRRWNRGGSECAGFIYPIIVPLQYAVLPVIPEADIDDT